jgi:hypothetical protein
LFFPCVLLSQAVRRIHYRLGDIYKSMDASAAGAAGTSIAMPTDHAINTPIPQCGLPSRQPAYRWAIFSPARNKNSQANCGKTTESQWHYGLLSIDTSLGCVVGFG